MGHEVRLTERAFEEIDAIVGYISRDSPQAAIHWQDAILRKAASLANFPLRHSLAPEASVVGVEVRQTFHGSYRILYVVDGNDVIVHGIRHGARLPLEREEFFAPPREPK
jgi:plasmid stabilization system protein ParE